MEMESLCSLHGMLNFLKQVYGARRNLETVSVRIRNNRSGLTMLYVATQLSLGESFFISSTESTSFAFRVPPIASKNIWPG